MKKYLLLILKSFDFHCFYEDGVLHIDTKIKGLELLEEKDVK